jgi:cbb3-type cytochrome oxidase subunit 3
MLQEVLQSIESVAVYPIIGLVIFVAAFAYVIVHVWRMKRGEIEHASRLPLDEGAGRASTIDRAEDRQGEAR